MALSIIYSFIRKGAPRKSSYLFFACEDYLGPIIPKILSARVADWAALAGLVCI